jgi:hypothetical protein
MTRASFCFKQLDIQPCYTYLCRVHVYVLPARMSCL